MTTALWVIFLTVLIAFAALVLVLGVSLLATVLRTGRAATERAAATVVGHRVQKGDEGETFYYPIARFTASGTEREVVGLVGHNRLPYRVGQVVTVYYPKGQPEEAQFDRFGVWPLPLLMVAVGAGFMFGAGRELVRVFLG